MLFSNKELSKIIIPIFIEQVLAVAIGMMDTVMVASAGEAAVSGVSLVDTINVLMIYVFNALASGGAVAISQLLGAGRKGYASEAAKQLVWVVGLVSVLFMSIMLIFRTGLLKVVFGSIDADVMANARIYFLYTAMSYPFLALYNAGAAIFRAVGNSKISMTTSIIMNVINLFGNAVLIFVFHMGAAGAAIATLFSRVVGAVMMICLVQKKSYDVYVDKLIKYKPDFYLIKRICVVGIPNGAENGMFQLGKLITQSLVSSFGTIQIAANAAASTLVTLQYTPGSSMGTAMVAVVGRCVGAGETKQAKKYAGKLLAISYVLMFVISVPMAIFAKPLAALFGLSPEGVDIVVKLLVIHAVFVSTFHSVAFCLANSFRAANDVKYTLIISTISMWVFRIGLSYVFGLYMQMGVIGVWLAMMCDWVFRGTLFAVRFIRGTWLTKYKDDIPVS